MNLHQATDQLLCVPASTISWLWSLSRQPARMIGAPSCSVYITR